MKSRRTTRLLVEPPSSATGDIAFNLIVFFLVCASVQPDTGRSQTIPRSEQEEEEQDDKNIEVEIRRRVVLLNGNVLSNKQFSESLVRLLKNKNREEDRIVVVKSNKDVEYQQWMNITEIIETAGGIVTIQTEETRTIQVE